MLLQRNCHNINIKDFAMYSIVLSMLAKLITTNSCLKDCISPCGCNALIQRRNSKEDTHTHTNECAPNKNMSREKKKTLRRSFCTSICTLIRIHVWPPFAMTVCANHKHSSSLYTTGRVLKFGFRFWS